MEKAEKQQNRDKEAVRWQWHSDKVSASSAGSSRAKIGHWRDAK